MSPLETSLDVGVTLRSKLDSSGNVYSIYPVTRDIDVALTTLGEDNALTLDDKLKVYDEKHQEASSDIESLKKSIWSGTRAELMVAIENGEIADGTTVYITDDYSGEGQDLSEYAKIDYVNDTFVPLEEGKGLSSTDVTSSDVERWNTSSDIATRLDGDATVDGSVSQKIAEVISGAPEKYDTLVEIANWIESDTDGAAAMDLKISENAKNIELKLDKDGGDTADTITTFTSNDTPESTSWTDVDVMGSGEKHNSLFGKISTMFKNIRYLYKLLGTTSISGIGDGTVSGAISTLNSNYINASCEADVTTEETFVKTVYTATEFCEVSVSAAHRWGYTQPAFIKLLHKQSDGASGIGATSIYNDVRVNEVISASGVFIMQPGNRIDLYVKGNGSGSNHVDVKLVVRKL